MSISNNKREVFNIWEISSLHWSQGVSGRRSCWPDQVLLSVTITTQQFASIELIPAGPLCLPSLAARQRDSVTASISVWTVLNCLKWEENNLPIKLSWEGGREGLWYLLLSPPQYFYYLQWIILRSYSCHVLMFHLISILFWWWGGVRWNSYLLLTPLVMNTIMITGNNSTSIC